ncbi:uncharacterized protein LOC113291744 [Papaver somniferum]|uniref:uncharacterized protein LOC113291744 n=1 Tax=Papaver somniferum TaxID=3469 RepID=UPI000E6F7C39|nr:uncharacterized protein LOC113291744 [Papaver somniferum]
MNRSYVFRSLVTGKAPPVDFVVNRHSYDMSYYLGDGIYPEIATIIMSIKHPEGKKKIKFSGMQEGAQKDVEQGFGVLQQQFGIIKQPTRMWDPDVLAYIMKTHIILHNMIVQDERLPGEWPHVYEHRRNPSPVTISRENSEALSPIRAAQRVREMRNK